MLIKDNNIAIGMKRSHSVMGASVVLVKYTCPIDWTLAATCIWFCSMFLVTVQCIFKSLSECMEKMS